jgi:hypothetical protein
MFMSSAKRTEIPRYNVRNAGGRNQNMEGRQGNGREVINPGPPTTPLRTPSNEDISLFAQNKKETKNPVVFMHCANYCAEPRSLTKNGIPYTSSMMKSWWSYSYWRRTKTSQDGTGKKNTHATRA